MQIKRPRIGGMKALVPRPFKPRNIGQVRQFGRVRIAGQERRPFGAEAIEITGT